MNIPSTLSGAPQAIETLAQTRIKAAQGDIQAKMKLAMLAKMAGVRPASASTSAPVNPGTKPSTPLPPDASASPSEPPPPTGAVLNVRR